MEVHAHTHSSRKRWTHYLWEFLMLFLAVFCGFLAENKREHIVEKKRAKQYAKGFLSDLREDRSELERGSNQTAFYIRSLDSVIAIGNKIKDGASVPGSFYYYGRFCTGFFRIDWARATIDQLIQSGNLRYFGDKDLVSTINFYYYMQGIINAQNQLDMIQKDKLAEFRNDILLSRYYILFGDLDPVKESKKHEPSAIVDSLMSQKLPLQPGAISKIDAFINYASDRKAKLLLVLSRHYTLSKEILEEIANMLSKEYHLEILQSDNH